MSSPRRTARLAAATVAVALTTAGCTTLPAGRGGSEPKHLPPCARLTSSPGALTIATYTPTYPPWFVGDDPENGRGFEAALGYRLAQQLGVKPDRVRWTRMPFGSLVEGSSAPFDLALAEASVTEERERRRDFSRPYATTQQAVVTYAGSPIAGRTTLEGLRSARLGAVGGTTSAEAVTRVIGASREPVTYPSMKAAGEALARHEIDGVVTDLPTADYLADSVLDDGVLLGRMPTTEDEAAAVLPSDSRLRSCVDDALARLEKDGTLPRLRTTWLPDVAATPVLR